MCCYYQELVLSWERILECVLNPLEKVKDFFLSLDPPPLPHFKPAIPPLPWSLLNLQHSDYTLQVLYIIHVKDNTTPALPPTLTKLYIIQPRNYLSLFF